MDSKATNIIMLLLSVTVFVLMFGVLVTLMGADALALFP